MKNGLLVSMSAIAAFGIGALVFTSEPETWAPAVVNMIDPEEPILVVIVGRNAMVDSVRAAVSKDRIVADTGDAFALVDRRIIAASAEAASGPINKLGWIDDPLDLVAVSGGRGREWEQNRNKPGSGKNGKLSDEDQANADKIASLLNKPTLTAGEATQLLQHMDQTGQF